MSRRIESGVTIKGLTSDTNALVISGNTYNSGNVGIGVAVPLTRLEVSADSNSAAIVSTAYGASTVYGKFVMRKANGTFASPTQVLSSNIIGGVGAAGYHSGAAFHTAVSGQIQIIAAENFTSTAKGANIAFATVPIGTVSSPLVRMTVTSEGLVGIGTITPAVRLDVSGDIAHRSLTPASFSTNQNDYSTAGTSFIRLNNTAGSVDISGFANGFDGKRLIVANIGANQIQLMNQNASSAAANRMILYNPTSASLTDLQLDPNEAIELIYDAVSSRWRNINSLGPQI